MSLPSGIYTLPQTMERGNEGMTVFPVAIADSQGLILLDVGFSGQLQQITENLREHGYEWNDIHSVLITHQDPDHAGALEDVLDRTDVVVYAHRRCAPFLDGRKAPIKSVESQYSLSARVDVEVTEGVIFWTDSGPMEVLFTPGHAPGHISFHFPDEHLLIAADAMVAENDDLRLPREEFTLDMEQAVESLQTLQKRSIELVHCYHGGLVETDPEKLATTINSFEI